MPVPVPRLNRQPAHPINKAINGQTIPIFAGSKPAPQLGTPPSFWTREEWNSSLPSWRRPQQRPYKDENCISYATQDFCQGLTVAENATVIKGAPAEACIPPTYHLSQLSQTAKGRIHGPDQTRMLHAIEDQVDTGFTAVDQAQFDSHMQWDVDFLVSDGDMIDAVGVHRHQRSVVHSAPGTFSPVYEDHSPASGVDSNPSPLEPVTPFGEFVDRAVAEPQSCSSMDNSRYGTQNVIASHYEHNQPTLEVYKPPPVFPSISDFPKEPDPIVDTVTPSATVGYKTLAEPLSEWVANYVWKICTTGFSLPPAFTVASMNAGPYAVKPPSDLVPSIHSLLLSTLLQPSAVLLAIWYIVRLPVYFGAAPLSPEFPKERAFRAALLGDGYAGFETGASDASAAFRLVVLGCMLANKWLDDHTFSNKTWHSISNISVQTLNKIEALTLDIFSYDLSISSQQWSQWLSHAMSYHTSLSSPTFPQPISRPSSNPHSIIRRTIEEIMQAPSSYKSVANIPQPVFLGLEERLRERMEKEQAMAMDILEIDLDEDGPLREEYLPKRRASKLGSQTSQSRHGNDSVNGQNLGAENWGMPDISAVKTLPPPAKWSPAGDEPILRDRNRVSGQYVAVQAPRLPMAPYPPNCQPLDNQNWNPPSMGYMPVKSQPGYVYDIPPVFRVGQPIYNPFEHFAEHFASLAASHSRSQSLSYDQDNTFSRNHMRSYSQTRFNYHRSDIRGVATQHVPSINDTSHWMEAAGHYGYPGPAYIHIPAVNMQSAW